MDVAEADRIEAAADSLFSGADIDDSSAFLFGILKTDMPRTRKFALAKKYVRKYGEATLAKLKEEALSFGMAPDSEELRSRWPWFDTYASSLALALAQNGKPAVEACLEIISEGDLLRGASDDDLPSAYTIAVAAVLIALKEGLVGPAEVSGSLGRRLLSPRIRADEIEALLQLAMHIDPENACRLLRSAPEGSLLRSSIALHLNGKLKGKVSCSP